MYSYDLNSGLLETVTSGRETRHYLYNEDSSLESVSYTDGTKIELLYNKMGHISVRRYVNSLGETLSSQEYEYTDGGMVRLKSDAVEEYIHFVYSETGELISVMRPGFNPDKILTTKDTHIDMEGDHVSTNSKTNKLLIISIAQSGEH